MVRKLKHTEIGDIPVDWELQTFDETFRVLSNNTLSRENLNNRGGAVRNIHYGDILTKFPEVLNCKEEIPYVNELSLLSSSTQLLQDGDIVIADTAEDETVGKVTEVQNLGDSKLVAGLHTIPCRVKKGDFAPGWLGYYMNSNLFHNQILPYITGIKVSSISKGAISETLILVPPFDEQEKIVQSLNEVQLLMTAETKVVNKMKFVKNGCLSKMFPQKDATVPEMRLPGFTEAWEQRKLKGMCTIITKQTGFDYSATIKPSLVTTKEDDTYSFIQNKDFEGLNINLDTDFYIPISVAEKYPKITLDQPSLLISISGRIGNIGLYSLDSKAFIGGAVGICKLKDIEDGKTTLYELSSPAGQMYFNSLIKASSHANITVEDIRNIEVLLPKHVEERKKINIYFENLDNLITLHQCKCDKYSNIKKGMMSDLLTGKIRLV